MNITILNGNPDSDNIKFDNYIKTLSELLKTSSHAITVFKLREMDIKYCTGCWGCWVKTPGKCVFEDDSDKVCRSYINSDFALFASPVIMGFTSSLLKKAHDKLTPLIHPYFEIIRNECHHLSRYDKYPFTGLLIQRDKNTDYEDIKIISDIYKRNAINLKTSLLFVKIMDDSVKEVTDAINNI